MNGAAWTEERIAKLREMVAAGLDGHTIKNALGCAYKTVFVKAAEYGCGPVQPKDRRRPVPADFVTMAERLGFQQLVEHYRAGYTTMRRWFAETGTPLRQRTPAPPPEGFADTHGMTQAAAAARYGVSVDIVRRWDSETGIDRRAEWISRMTRLARSQPRARPASASAAATRAQSVRTAKLPTPFDAAKRDWSPAGQAADFLRRFGPVARCDAGGRYDPEGDHWRRGSSILTAADVIARAERNGWQRDAWSKLA